MVEDILRFNRPEVLEVSRFEPYRSDHLAEERVLIRCFHDGNQEVKRPEMAKPPIDQWLVMEFEGQSHVN